jgi:small-conductance mechanosensitive channel
MDSSFLAQLLEWSTRSWFRLGNTDITPAAGCRAGGDPVLLLVVCLAARTWSAAGGARRQEGSSSPSRPFYALTRIVRYLVWIVGSIVGLSYLGFDLASLAILGGAMGVGIGFGLQNIFSNLVSGILILVEKTLKLGDFVDLQSGVVGKVTEIGLRYTRVTTNDNVDVIVPNSEFINGRVTNWTLDDHLRRLHIPFGVAYGTDKELVRSAVTAAAREVVGTIDLPGRGPDVWLVNFGESSLDFELVVWVGQDLAMSPGRTHARYLWEIESALGKAGIEIPFPQRDLHVRSGRLTVDLAGAASTAQSKDAGLE